MKQYMKVYDVILRTKGPVFVGSGKIIGSKEYAFLSKSKIGIPDIADFYQLLKKRRKDREYEKFILENKRDDLNSWLRNHSIMPEELVPCMRYELDCGDIVIEKRSRLQIVECIKDPYGNPYIPGSSIKGMFRTLFLNDNILQQSRKFSNIKNNITSQVFARAEGKINRTAFLKNDSTSIESIAYRTLNRQDTRPGDAVNDIMQGFIVSDSEPLSVNDLYLCQKIDLHTSGEEKRLPIIRECIKPDTEIKFTLTIDQSICPITEKEILDAIAHFNEQYQQCYAQAFPNIDKLCTRDVFLGGGSGFVSKTVVYSLYGKKEGLVLTKNIYRKTGVPREHKHEKDSEYGVSPHVYKCGCYNGKLLPMGMCTLDMNEE